MHFSSFALSPEIQRAIASEGYTIPTPVQAQSIPHVLEGRDLLACAQTGTGKTAAFALPILHRLSTGTKPASGAGQLPRVLILCPTRELATQISDSFRAYGSNSKLRTTIIFGGVSQFHQVKSLRQGTDIIIATPGRLLDLLNQNVVNLKGIQTLVLDEADRMLDMGFINDIRKVVAKLPTKRQTLLFSATMPQEIRALANSLLHNPASVQVAPASATADNIEQSVYHVKRGNKPQLLAHLYHSLPMARTIVFTRTKRGADKVVRHLHTRGIRSEAIHGNKTQGARERALANFRNNKTPILVATDIASRGIDIDDITHIVNYDLTHEPETYVHRIGRTARAGASGCAVSFCDVDELPNLKSIEKLLRRPIAVKNDHPAYVSMPAPQDDFHSDSRDSRRGSSHSTRTTTAARPSRTQQQTHPTPPRSFPSKTIATRQGKRSRKMRYQRA